MWRNERRLPNGIKFTTATAIILFAIAALPNRSLAQQDAESSSLADFPRVNRDTEQQRTSTPESIEVNGVTRTFSLYVPASYQAGTGALLIALHGRGAGGPGVVMEQYSQLDETAARTGFAVVYLDALPDATGVLNWNFFYNPFFQDPPADIDFVRQTLDLLESRLHPDRRRIYVTGISAGGFMAQRVGVELSDRIAAIGVVQGNLYVTTPSSPQSIPQLASPVSVLLIKGDQDPNNHYCGAVFPTFGIVESSADQDFTYWSGPQGNHCALVFPAAPLCQTVGTGDAQANVTPGTPTAQLVNEALACRQFTEVRLYRLIGGEDIWNQTRLNIPGQTPYNPYLNLLSGVRTNGILFRFFLTHPKLNRR